MRGSRSAALLIAALTISFLYLSLFILPATPRLLAADQFINFDNARRMAAGQVLYRDIFQYTLPGTELLEVPLIKIFGARLALTNALLIVVGAADVWLALFLASTVLRRGDAFLAGLLFLCFGFHGALDATHHAFSVLLVYAAAATIVRRRSVSRIAAAGALLGLATCFTQTRGLVALAVGAFLVWENRLKPESERHLWRDEISLFTPFTILAGAGCAYVIWSGGLARFFRDIVEFPLLYYRQGYANSWSTSFFLFFPTARGIAEWILMKLLVPGAYLAFGIYSWGAAKRGDDRVSTESTLLAIFGFALFATIAYAAPHVRLAEVSLPAIILTIWMLDRSGATTWKLPAWIAVTGFLVVAPISTQLQRYWFYDAPAGRIAISDPDLFSELNWLGEHTNPGDKFFAGSTPMLYVLMDLRNPAPVPFVEPDDYTRPLQAQAAASRLREARPKFVLWPFAYDDADDPGDRLYPLGQVLRADYRPVLSLRDGDVWELKQDAARD